MSHILCFAGSNSSTSINYKLVKYTASLIQSSNKILVLNMANFPFPMYSEDYEKSNGFSNSLREFRTYIQESNGLLISANEHNGNPSAYFKNVIDWLSRLDKKFLEEKKVFLMGASPGKRGAQGSLEVLTKMLPRFGAEVVTTFSLPSFNANFNVDLGITDSELAKMHKDALSLFLTKI